LPRQRWYGAKSHNIQSVRILHWSELLVDAQSNDPYRNDLNSPSGSQSRPVLCFVEVSYFDRHPDIYQIPLAISLGAEAKGVLSDHPDGILTKLKTTSGDAIVHDAAVSGEFRRGLLMLIAGDRTLALCSDQAFEGPLSAMNPTDSSFGDDRLRSGAEAEMMRNSAGVSPVQEAVATPHSHLITNVAVAPVPLEAQPGEAAAAPRSSAPTSLTGAQPSLQPRESPSAGNPAPIRARLEARASSAFTNPRITEPLSSKVSSGEQSNTSIVYGRQLILKLFRHLESGENPDVEIGRYLTEIVRFSRIPEYQGKISLVTTNSEAMTVAMLQRFVENEGDGWQWYSRELMQWYGKVSQLPAQNVLIPAESIGSRTDGSERNEAASSMVEAAALLGRRTAEMHLALGQPSQVLAFAPEQMTANDLERDVSRIENQLA